jgi:hypothetical protein
VLDVLLQLPVTVIDVLNETRMLAVSQLFFWGGIARLIEPVLEPSIPELIYRTDHSQDLPPTSIVKKSQQTYRSLASTPQLCAG